MDTDHCHGLHWVVFTWGQTQRRNKSALNPRKRKSPWIGHSAQVWPVKFGTTCLVLNFYWHCRNRLMTLLFGGQKALSGSWDFGYQQMQNHKQHLKLLEGSCKICWAAMIWTLNGGVARKCPAWGPISIMILIRFWMKLMGICAPSFRPCFFWVTLEVQQWFWISKHEVVVALVATCLKYRTMGLRLQVEATDGLPFRGLCDMELYLWQIPEMKCEAVQNVPLFCTIFGQKTLQRRLSVFNRIFQITCLSVHGPQLLVISFVTVVWSSSNENPWMQRRWRQWTSPNHQKWIILCPWRVPLAFCQCHAQMFSRLTVALWICTGEQRQSCILLKKTRLSCIWVDSWNMLEPRTTNKYRFKMIQAVLHAIDTHSHIDMSSHGTFCQLQSNGFILGRMLRPSDWSALQLQMLFTPYGGVQASRVCSWSAGLR